MAPVLRPTLETERRLWRAGHQWVAGVDEVGRGAWAGPLSVGVAVVHAGLRTRSIPAWLRDSKALSEERREDIFGRVADWCADAAIGHAAPEECDRYGMTLAWRLAAYRALAALEVRPDAVVLDGPWDLLTGPKGKGAAPADGSEAEALDADTADADAMDADTADADAMDADTADADAMDADTADADAMDADTADAEHARPGGMSTDLFRPPRDTVAPLPAVTLPDTVLPKVRADATCAAVAAASVLAKVVRDRWMREESEHFPAYDFDRNKGYPSPHHQIALRGYGLSAIHRRTWAYVAHLPWR